MKNLIFALIFLAFCHSAHSTNLMGRMGIGLTNQLVNDMPALSTKVQSSRTFSWGALLAVDANSDDTDYGAGLKFYRHLFDEPNLTFFASGMTAILKQGGESGYQVDGTLGAEFHIPGLESIGFMFEAGLSVNKHHGQRHIQTLGNHIIKSAIHFYL